MTKSEEAGNARKVTRTRKGTPVSTARPPALLRKAGHTHRTTAALGKRGANRQLRILVIDLATGQAKTSVQIPVGLIDAGLKIGAQLVPAGTDPAVLLDAVRSGASGKILEVTDKEAQ